MSAPEPEPAPGEAPPSSAQPGYGQAEAVKEATPPEAAAPPAAPSAPPGGGGRGCAALLPPKFDGASAISICAFGYLGVFLRLALKAFSSWWSVEQPGTCQLLGQIGHGFFLPNIVGCFLMGFAKRAAEFHWGRHGLAYTGFTTGLCGCLTTFATWNQAASMQIVRGNVSDGLLVLLLQHVVALSFLQLGKHAADELARAGLSKPWAGAASFGSWYRGCAYKRLVSATAAHETATASATAVEKQIGGFSFPADGGGGGLDAEAWGSASLAKQSGAGGALESLASSMAKAEAASAAGAGRDASSSRPPAAAFAVAMGALTVAAWLVVFIADSGSGAQFWALSIALSPVGAVLRYTLGLKNGSGPWGADFPWGTAAANILGSGFSCLCFILSVQSSKASELAALGVTGTALQDAIAADNSDTYLLILHAVATGLCGSLSTVSTYINEIDGFHKTEGKTMAGYRYALGSEGLTQLLLLMMNGLHHLTSSHI